MGFTLAFRVSCFRLNREFRFRVLFLAFFALPWGLGSPLNFGKSLVGLGLWIGLFTTFFRVLVREDWCGRANWEDGRWYCPGYGVEAVTYLEGGLFNGGCYGDDDFVSYLVMYLGGLLFFACFGYGLAIFKGFSGFTICLCSIGIDVNGDRFGLFVMDFTIFDTKGCQEGIIGGGAIEVSCYDITNFINGLGVGGVIVIKFGVGLVFRDNPVNCFLGLIFNRDLIDGVMFYLWCAKFNVDDYGVGDLDFLRRSTRYCYVRRFVPEVFASDRFANQDYCVGAFGECRYYGNLVISNIFKDGYREVLGDTMDGFNVGCVPDVAFRAYWVGVEGLDLGTVGVY